MIANPDLIERHHLPNQAAPMFALIHTGCTYGKPGATRQLGQYGR